MNKRSFPSAQGDENWLSKADGYQAMRCGILQSESEVRGNEE